MNSLIRAAFAGGGPTSNLRALVGFNLRALVGFKVWF